MQFDTTNWRRLGLCIGAFFSVAAIATILQLGFIQGSMLTLVLVGLFVGVVLGLVATIWLSVLLHELGHLTMARIRGFEVYEVTVWGRTLFIRGKRIAVQLGPGTLGYVLAFKSRPSRNDLILFYLGGPLFSLVAALVSLYLWRFSPAPTHLLTAIIGVFFLFLCLWSGMMFVFSLSLRIQHADAARIRSLVRNPSETIRLHVVQGELRELLPLRPKNYDLNILEASRPLIGDVTFYLFSSWHSFDRENPELAYAETCSAYNTVIENSESGFYAAMACIEMSTMACLQNDRNLSDAALDMGKKLLATKLMLTGPNVAREFAWGDKQKAVDLARASLIEFEKTRPSAELLEYAKEWYQKIVPEMDVPAAASAPPETSN
ncbi:MAG: M50 family metallopeptidase [Armatimonadetes bacterium]|nr:M50 family metallopeptidase [Armatimonadota bacterium]